VALREGKNGLERRYVFETPLGKKWFWAPSFSKAQDELNVWLEGKPGLRWIEAYAPSGERRRWEDKGERGLLTLVRDDTGLLKVG
jgi:hypothetical protein